LRFDPVAGQVVLTAERMRMIKCLKFLEFLRNQRAHRLQPLAGFIGHKNQNQNPNYNLNQIKNQLNQIWNPNQIQNQNPNLNQN
jgi:hypothetical protein